MKLAMTGNVKTNSLRLETLSWDPPPLSLNQPLFDFVLMLFLGQLFRHQFFTLFLVPRMLDCWNFSQSHRKMEVLYECLKRRCTER